MGVWELTWIWEIQVQVPGFHQAELALELGTSTYQVSTLTSRLMDMLEWVDPSTPNSILDLRKKPSHQNRYISVKSFSELAPSV